MDAPVERYTYATFWQRFGAGVIDAVIVMPVWFAASWLVLKSLGDAWIVGHVATNAVLAAYPIVFHAIYGQTPGKMCVGVSVRNVDAQPIGWPQALRRSAVELVLSCLHFAIVIAAWRNAELRITPGMSVTALGIAMGSVPFALAVKRLNDIWFWSEMATMLMNKRRRALHDLIAGTVVLRRLP